jgi:hypothetical protein
VSSGRERAVRGTSSGAGSSICRGAGAVFLEMYMEKLEQALSSGKRKTECAECSIDSIEFRATCCALEGP